MVGGGTFSEMDFFRRLKNDEDFFWSGGGVGLAVLERSSIAGVLYRRFGSEVPFLLFDLVCVDCELLGRRCVSLGEGVGPLDDPNTLLKKPGR